MLKTTIMFPGQGAQKVGMGKTFYDNEKKAKDIFMLASEITGIDIPKLCFEENSMLSETKYTQIALLTTELAILICAEEHGLKYDNAIGLSLGEYAALVSSEAISYEDALKAVLKRGEYMQNAYPNRGAMAVVLGLDCSIVEEICQNSSGIISIANYNCSGQYVVTGEKDAVEDVCKRFDFEGAKKCQILDVSGPFHCKLMKKAADQMAELLNTVDFYDIKKPYISNVTGDFVTNKDCIRELLVKQIVSPVRYMQGIETLIADGTNKFVEIGPGTSLRAIVKRISKNVQIVNIETLDDLMSYINQ